MVKRLSRSISLVQAKRWNRPNAPSSSSNQYSKVMDMLCQSKSYNRYSEDMGSQKRMAFLNEDSSETANLITTTRTRRTRSKIPHEGRVKKAEIRKSKPKAVQ